MSPLRGILKMKMFFKKHRHSNFLPFFISLSLATNAHSFNYRIAKDLNLLNHPTFQTAGALRSPIYQDPLFAYATAAERFHHLPVSTGYQTQRD